MGKITRDELAPVLNEELDNVNSSLAENANDIINGTTRQALTPKMGTAYTKYNPFGIPCIPILGDSISHGAHSLDIFNDSYVGILRKMLNFEYNTDNIGFVTCVDKFTIDGGSTYEQNIHTILSNTGWTLVNAATSKALNAAHYSATVDGSEIVYSMPTMQKSFALTYRRFNGGGTFEVYINDILQYTKSTDSGDATDTFFNLTASIPLSDNGTGSATIKIKKVSGGEVDFSGMYYFNTRADFQLMNFSQSGRAILTLTHEQIDICCSCGTMIFALGTNDIAETGADQTTSINNLNYLISSAISHKTKLIILDFAWTTGTYPAYRWVSDQLKIVHDSVPGSTYINFDQNTLATGETVKSGDLTTYFGFTLEGTHPTVKGHKFIAETIANVLGLSASSKNMAERHDKIWKPFTLLNGWANGSTDPVLISAWRENGNEIEVRLYLTLPVSDSQYAQNICNLPSKASPCFDEKIGFWQTPRAGGLPKAFWLQLLYGSGTALQIIKNTTDIVPSQSIISITFNVPC